MGGVGPGMPELRAQRNKILPATVAKSTHIYAHQPTEAGPLALQVDIYRPMTTRRCPLLVWLHSGGFWRGTRRNRNHQQLAVILAQHGYASAFPDYRLSKDRALLGPAAQSALARLTLEAEQTNGDLPATLRGPVSIAAMEDAALFLQWIDQQRDRFVLNRAIVLGGSSAGAITALNTLLLAPALGIPQPQIRCVLSISGAFAYPSVVRAATAPIFALHSPLDRQVPIASIRRLKLGNPEMVTLLELPELSHGWPMVERSETLQTAVGRLIAFDQTIAGWHRQAAISRQNLAPGNPEASGPE